MQHLTRLLVAFIALLIVGLGQPAGVPSLGLIAGLCGYALLFVAISALPARWRFVWGTIWFACITAWQLRWFGSHPYAYIYAVQVAVALVAGCQFGLLCLMSSQRALRASWSLLAIPSLWVLLEWSRLWWFSGLSFNPAGLALCSNRALLQTASCWGVYGLSWLVMLINCLVARMVLGSRWAAACAAMVIAIVAATGSILLMGREDAAALHAATHRPYNVLVVAMEQLPEELGGGTPLEQATAGWDQIFKVLAPWIGQPFDVIVLPEVVVPFPAHSPMYSGELMEQLLGYHFPDKEFAFAKDLSSADIAYELAQLFQAPVIIGLEGTELHNGRVQYYNSAYWFAPNGATQRYDKQVLVPMGEYIPFEWAKTMAARYGLYGSFHPGTGPVLFDGHIAPSICYEETFGHIMARNVGATLFVNITNDGWYPNSSLAQQHFEHARPRTVENGVPLVRSCNFGVSGAIDSLGRTIATLPNEKIVAMAIGVPTYTYSTYYQYAGDLPVLALSVGLLILSGLVALASRRSAP